jgi:hypothetical protein
MAASELPIARRWELEPKGHMAAANNVVWGRTSTELNLLSRIFLRISLAELKAKSKKMTRT